MSEWPSSTSTLSKTCSLRTDRSLTSQRGPLRVALRRGSPTVSYRTGVAVVIADGSFNLASDRAAFEQRLDSNVSPFYVTLNVTFEEALRRAQSDPTRGVSRDPAFLAGYFAAATKAYNKLPATDVVDRHGVGTADRCRRRDRRHRATGSSGTAPALAGWPMCVLDTVRPGRAIPRHAASLSGPTGASQSVQPITCTA